MFLLRTAQSSICSHVDYVYNMKISMYVDDMLCQSSLASNSGGASAVVSSQIGRQQTSLLVSSNTLEQNPVS